MQIGPTVVDCEVSPDLASLSMTTPQGQRAHAVRGDGFASPANARTAAARASTTASRSDFPGIAIVGVRDLGYGLNIAFSDGHDRGIYPKTVSCSISPTTDFIELSGPVQLRPLPSGTKIAAL